MSTIDINFHQVRPHGGSRDHGFEELCSQLAYLEDRPTDSTYFRKGKGADAGVECVVRHADESETGWQAKYFFSLGPAQQKQLEESIGQALDKHPRLTRFIVCVPFDLRDARQGKKKSERQRWEEWVDNWTNAAKKRQRALKIELWDASALTERLSRKDPRYEGRIDFWFDQAFFTADWFKSRFEQARAGLGERYTPETNVELPIRQSLLAFCRDPAALHEIEKASEKLEEAGHRAINDVRRVNQPERLGEALGALERTSASLLKLLNSVSPEPGYAFPIEQFKAKAVETSKAASACASIIWDMRSEAKETEQLRNAGYFLRQFDAMLDDFLELLGSERWKVVNAHQLLVYGDAGVGKSHLFGDAAECQISKERPALLILGGTLREADPWSQIIDQAGLQGMSSEVLLGALDAAGQAAGVRTVVFIDAINERHGIDLWATRLAPFLQTIARFPHVAVALSCRSTYLPYIIDPRAGLQDLQLIEHVGFAGNAAAARYYLDRRGMVRMAAPNLIPEFHNPLFLKTCCDFLIKSGKREFPRGLRGVTSLFEFYSQAVAKAIEQRMKLDRGQRIVERALAELAAAFDDGERGYVDWDAAQALLEQILPSHGSYERSLLAQLESEGVVAIEPMEDDTGKRSEGVRFTFERYSDHRIAHRLLERHLDKSDPGKAFAAGAALRAYIERQDVHRCAGVIEALATQIPERCDQELQDLLSDLKKNRVVLTRAFVQSVLWRNQVHFTKRTVELLKQASQLTGRNELNNALIAVATEPENRFNADYLHGRLMPLSMPERDRVWSIYLVTDQEEDGSNLEALISWTTENGREPMEERRAELAAITLGWTLSVSDRRIRDRATKALAGLLSVRLEMAARLVSRFGDVNDLYVLERVLAAAYGAAMQGLTVEGLANLGQAAYSCVFSRATPIVHLLVRDYARGIVELAANKGVLPRPIDINRARPPYRSPWPIEGVPEALIETYRQDYGRGEFFTEAIVSSAVNDGDFARYVIDPSVRDWSSLPISVTGVPLKALFKEWKRRANAKYPEAKKIIAEITRTSARLRAIYDRLGVRVIRIVFRSPGDGAQDKGDDIHPDARPIEERLTSAENDLRQTISDELWQEYLLIAQPHLLGGIPWRNPNVSWPPLFDMRDARRWVCKRAHELGWTPERFAQFDGHVGSRDRTKHRVERIGKKYQWIALHELLAHLADNTMFIGDRGEEPAKYEGPWQPNRRDIDPSLLTPRTFDDGWRQWEGTWWMPLEIKLRPINAMSRLRWLNGPDDFLKDHRLINVDDPKTRRQWTVLHETVAWRQWAMRDGDRRLERTTWFRLQCVLVKANERDALVQALASKMVTDDDDIPKITLPSDGFIGEYPWHIVYKDIQNWVKPWRELPVAAQPVVTHYEVEQGGYDYSIEGSFAVKLPSPALVQGLDLHLSNGRDLSYADPSGTVRFFDPSVHEAGPSAALVDRDAFFEFLRRNELTAVWTIGGMKSVHGGKRWDEGWGGDRMFSSVFFLTDAGFQRLDHFEEREATRDPLVKLLEEDAGDSVTLGTPDGGHGKC